MADELKIAILILWMGTLPLGAVIVRSFIRPRPALVPVRSDDGRVFGRGR